MMSATYAPTGSDEDDSEHVWQYWLAGSSAAVIPFVVVRITFSGGRRPASGTNQRQVDQINFLYENFTPVLLHAQLVTFCYRLPQ